MQYGRKEIYTDVYEINSDNIISVLQKAVIDFTQNASDCDFLLKYEAGDQPLQREKTYRSDIDCHCVDNIANEITEFKLGFNWGNPITLVQRGEKDSGTSEEAAAISLLNECYEAEQIKKKTQQLARFIEICGIGYTIVDINTEYEDGDSYFKVDVLDPRNTFVIKSSRYVDHRPMLGVSFRKDEIGNYYYTCFTKNERFEILNLCKIVNDKPKDDEREWKHDNRSGEENPLHRIPITEWIRSHDRMGCFERQIDDMNCLNLIESDICNATDESVQSIWHCNDVDFPTETITLPDGTTEERVRHPENNEWMQTFTSQDGKTPFVTPLSSDFDYAGNLNYALSKRALILQKCNVPQRNDNSGGSTGVAMSDATGWSAAESAACKEQSIIEGCKMEEVKSVLAAIKASTYIKQDNPMLKLKYTNVQPNIKRQKTYELTVKVNAICSLLSHGFLLDDTITMIPLAEDPNQVIERSGDGVRKYQESNVFKSGENQISTEEKRPFADYSDQEGNSPNIGGMLVENNDKKD